MIKLFIISALVLLASSQWAGQFTIYSSSYTGTGYTFCDLPPVGSSSSIAITGNTMSWTRQSTYQGTVTEPLNWSPNQYAGSACLPNGYCVQGNLVATTGFITLTWYLNPDSSDACVVQLQPTTPPISWIGQWRIVTATAQTGCTTPSQGSSVSITSQGAALLMVGGGGSWTLNWLATNDSPAQTCTGLLCTTGSLYMQGGKPAGTITWTYQNVYQCSVYIVPSSFLYSKRIV